MVRGIWWVRRKGDRPASSTNRERKGTSLVSTNTTKECLAKVVRLKSCARGKVSKGSSEIWQ